VNAPAPAFRGALAIVMRRVDDLVPYARNARQHSKAQLDKLAASIEAFGFNAPVLVTADDNGIIAGHGRVLAAKMAGLVQVPTVDLSHLSPLERRAYILADNRIGDEATWDEDLLASELAALAAAPDFDVSLAGFDRMEVDALFAKVAGPAEVKAARANKEVAPPAVPVSRPGDLWLLGRHRVHCGDSTAATVVARTLAGAKPNLMVTDPPYGVNYDPEWRQRAGIGGVGTATGKVTNDDVADWTPAWLLFPGNVAYVWHGGLHSATVAGSLARAKLLPRAQIVWVKNRLVISRGHYHWQHEPAWYSVREGERDAWIADWRFVPEHEIAEYAVRKGGTGDWSASRKESTVWFIEHMKSATGHGTQKPIECMARPMRNNSSPGDVVYDPFLGSGSTLLAAETERPCLLRPGDRPGLCRRDRPPLAGIHRPGRHAGRRWPLVRRGRSPSACRGAALAEPPAVYRTLVPA
jgi:DNA modification methylase